MFTVSGRRFGSDHTEPTLVTSHMPAERPTTIPVAGALAGARCDTKTSRWPSGENAGCESDHCPEKEATVGCRHAPLIL